MLDLLGMAAATIMGMLAAYAYIPTIVKNMEVPIHVVGGRQVAEVAGAAYKYVYEQLPAIDDRAAAAGGVLVMDVSELVTALKLPSGYSGQTLNGQTIKVVVRRVSEGVLFGVVKGCGGTAFADYELSAMAPYAANEYGTPAFIKSTDPNTIEVFGPGRSLVAANFSAAGCVSAAGQLGVILIWDGSDNPTNAWLNRYSVPALGTEPNTMRTDLYMTGCNDVATSFVDGCSIKGARTVELTTGLDFLVNGVPRWRFSTNAAGDLVLSRLNGSGAVIGTTVTYNLSTNSTTFSSDFYGPYYGYSSSDPSLKTDWRDLTPAQMDAAMAVRGRAFRWVENGRRDLGFNAEQVRALLPSATSVNPVTGKATVAYQAFIPLHHERIRALEAKLGALQRMIKDQKGEAP